MAAPWRRLALAVAFCSLLAARAAQATSGGYPLAMVQAAPVAFTEEEPEDLDATKEQDRERSTDIVNSEPGSDRASVSASLGDAGESQSEDRGQESNVSMGCAAVVATFTNCWGQDIGISWPVANVEECCGYCAGDSNCTAWTVDSRSVVDEPGTQGRCWLKSSCSDRRDDSLAISGFMAVDSVKTSDRVKTSSSSSATSSLTSTTSFTSTATFTSTAASTISASSTQTVTELTTSLASTATTTPSPFDCSVGVYSWKAGWSDSKKDWCCATHPPLGCPFRPADTAPFHCMSGHSTWEVGWSAAKKDWCCQHYPPLGCRNSTTDPFDCTAGEARWRVGWSEAKKSWCCRSHPPVGCPADQSERSVPFDCLDVTSGWEIEWSEVKKRWCCHEKTGYGCPVANGSAPTITSLESVVTNTTFSSTTIPTTTSTTFSIVSNFIDSNDTTLNAAASNSTTLNATGPIPTTSTSTTSKSTASKSTASDSSASKSTPIKSDTATTTTPMSTTSPRTEPSTSTISTTATTTTQQCFYAGFAYEPHDMGKLSIEKNIEACQERCSKTDGCRHFSFWTPGRHCYLEGSEAIRVANRPGFVAGPPKCCDATRCANQTLHGSGTYLPRELRCMSRAVQWVPELPGRSRVLGRGECPTQDSAVLACQRACADLDQCAHFTIVFPSRLCSLAGRHARPSRPVLGALSGPPACDDEEAPGSVGLYAPLAARSWLAGPGGHPGAVAAGVLGLGLACWAAVLLRTASRHPAGLGARAAVGRRYALLRVDSDDDEVPQRRAGRGAPRRACARFSRVRRRLLEAERRG